MFDVNELEREYRGFINQLRNGKNENSIPIKISEAKIEETIKNIKNVVNMFDMNEFEREYRGFINQLRERKTDKSIPIKISEAKIVKPNNINERYSKIMQLRKDIANGKIIKVYVGVGKFVWKRIK